tara:strand:- start:526 stop:963 length:438 start_codon:yes stop_codon:yes gene_type:complete
MNKTELKKMLRPLIKECIKEVIFEEGTLSTIISEVMIGTAQHQQPLMQENKQRVQLESNEQTNRRLQERAEKEKQRRKTLLDSIGNGAYNGIDLFEGTAPLSNRNSSQNSTPHGSQALDGIAPNDPGVNIGAFASSGVWKKLAGN